MTEQPQPTTEDVENNIPGTTDNAAIDTDGDGVLEAPKEKKSAATVLADQETSNTQIVNLLTSSPDFSKY